MSPLCLFCIRLGSFSVNHAELKMRQNIQNVDGNSATSRTYRAPPTHKVFLMTAKLSTCEFQFDQIFSLVSQGGGQILFTDLEKLSFWH